MKTIYNTSGEVVDKRDTLEEAILLLVELWHEADIPESFTIRDEEQFIAATVAPVGSDTAIVVYAHGQVDRYEGITYHRSPGGDGRITHTEARYNGGSLGIMIKDSKRIV